jgi:hypothetical protein
LPTASNFPFHVAPVGSQTSKLMCESLVGAENATTRQNATDTWRSLAGPAGPGGRGITRSGGGLIAEADVIVALGILSDVRLSQDCCAAAGAGTNANPARQTKHKNGIRRCLMRKPPPVVRIKRSRETYTPRPPWHARGQVTPPRPGTSHTPPQECHLGKLSNTAQICLKAVS